MANASELNAIWDKCTEGHNQAELERLVGKES